MKFIIEVPDKRGLTVEEWIDYIHIAVKAWGGSYPPSDPFFDLDYDEIKVKLYREIKHRGHVDKKPEEAV
jgi:hypothetical protein